MHMYISFDHSFYPQTIVLYEDSCRSKKLLNCFSWVWRNSSVIKLFMSHVTEPVLYSKFYTNFGSIRMKPIHFITKVSDGTKLLNLSHFLKNMARRDTSFYPRGEVHFPIFTKPLGSVLGGK